MPLMYRRISFVYVLLQFVLWLHIMNPDLSSFSCNLTTFILAFLVSFFSSIWSASLRLYPWRTCPTKAICFMMLLSRCISLSLCLSLNMHKGWTVERRLACVYICVVDGTSNEIETWSVVAGYVSNNANMMGIVNPAEPAVAVTKRRLALCALSSILLLFTSPGTGWRVAHTCHWWCLYHVLVQCAWVVLLIVTCS